MRAADRNRSVDREEEEPDEEVRIVRSSPMAANAARDTNERLARTTAKRARNATERADQPCAVSRWWSTFAVRRRQRQ